MLGKPLCMKCAEKMADANYPVEYRNRSSFLYAACAGCGRKKIVGAYLLADTPDPDLTEKVKEWVQADRDGCLYVFPFKRGDALYCIDPFRGLEIREVHIDAIHVIVVGKYFDENGRARLDTIDIRDFGKTAFLSRNDAIDAQEWEFSREKVGYMTEEQLSFFGGINTL